MCVFEIHVLKIFIERWFWELNMLIRSLVVLHVGLHSCLCFSFLEKLFWKAGSTPPRYLPRWLPRYFSILTSIEIYWGPIYSFFAIWFSFLRSLSICPHLFISQTLSLSLPTSSFVIFQAFSRFSSLGKLLISHSSCISCFET